MTDTRKRQIITIYNRLPDKWREVILQAALAASACYDEELTPHNVISIMPYITSKKKGSRQNGI